ncbi:hypothetical protein TAL182_PC00414 (plasmid) [Rhizobium sp. TAL182]|nr:hypothetical protein TAL182_PC00414 [Rhizobium sp. TAL182]
MPSHDKFVKGATTEIRRQPRQQARSVSRNCGSNFIYGVDGYHPNNRFYELNGMIH